MAPAGTAGVLITRQGRNYRGQIADPQNPGWTANPFGDELLQGSQGDQLLLLWVRQSPWRPYSPTSQMPTQLLSPSAMAKVRGTAGRLRPTCWCCPSSVLATQPVR